MKAYTPTLLLLAIALWGTACEKDDPSPITEQSDDYFFRVTLADGEVIEFDEAAVSHDPASNVYFIVAGLSECGPIVDPASDEFIYIFHVPAEENNGGGEVTTALVSNYPVGSGRLTAKSGRKEIPCSDSRSTIQRESSDLSVWRGNYTAEFFVDESIDYRPCTLEDDGGYVSIGEIRMEFNAPLLVCK